MLEKTLESPLDWKEIKQVNPKWNQSWIVIGSTDSEAEAPILCPPDGNNWLIGKDCDAGEDWRQEKRTIEDEMVGGHHWHNGHELGQALGVGDRQWSLACCSPWGRKESDTTKQVNWTEWKSAVQNASLSPLWRKSVSLTWYQSPLSFSNFIFYQYLSKYLIFQLLWTPYSFPAFFFLFLKVGDNGGHKQCHLSVISSLS